MSNKEKGKVLVKISRFLTSNMKAEIKLLTTQHYISETNIPENLSHKFDLVIFDDMQNIVLALDIEMSDSKEKKGFEEFLPFAYGSINKNLDFKILNPRKLPFDKTFGDIEFLVKLLKSQFPHLKTESDLIIAQIQQNLNEKHLELTENIKELDKLKIEVEFEKKMSSKKYAETLDLMKKEEKQQQYNFDKCEVLDLMLIAREKIDLPTRTGTESSMALSNGTDYRYEKSSSNDAFEFKLRFEFGIWLLKISFLGKHEEYGYELMEEGVAFYYFDKSKIEFIQLSSEKRKLLEPEQTWIHWDRVMNS